MYLFRRRFERVTQAVEQWSDRERFPVQFKLPLMYTIGIMIKVSNVSLITNDTVANDKDDEAPPPPVSWWTKAFGTAASAAPACPQRVKVEDNWFVIPPDFHHCVSQLKL